MTDGTTFPASSPPPHPPPISSPPSPDRKQDLTTFVVLMMVLYRSNDFLRNQRFRLLFAGQLIFLLQCAIIITALTTESLSFVRGYPSIFTFVALLPPFLFGGLISWTIGEYLDFIGERNEIALAYNRFHQHLFNAPPREDYIADGRKARSRLIEVCVFSSLASILLAHMMINFVVYDW